MRARTTVALALLLTLTGCAGTDEPTDGPATPEPSTSSSSPTEEPTGGAVEPTTTLLDWEPTGVPPGDRYVRGTDAEIRVEPGNGLARVTYPGASVEIPAGRGRTISEILLSEQWAVVVRQDTAETAPSKVELVDLVAEERATFAGPEPASGVSWALTGGDLYYPTYGDDRAYCLATSALADSNGEDGWCAPEGTGFSALTASEHGVGMMTFDDARPACRTVNLLEAGVPQPLEGPTACIAWDVAATADGAVWSEVPKPRRQEEAVFRARADGALVDLGPGTTGTAVPCGDSVFFVRDPQGPDEPARLMRWTPEHTLEIAYESASLGNAFLGEPTCGGGVLALSSYGEEGDESVWAPVS